MVDLADLDKIPTYLRSLEASLFHSLKEAATIKVTVPDDLKQKAELMLQELFSNSVQEIGDKDCFYRARIHNFDQTAPFDIDKMGAPEKGKASLGRLQPTGEPVLYTANKLETAIAEVRPAFGSHVSVAEFSPLPQSQLRILNLAKYEAFDPDAGPDGLTPYMVHLEKAMRFSEREFSRQVYLNDPKRYLDTIYITQLIREQGFHGIAYRSLLHDEGLNYAFFYPEDLICKTASKVWQVRSVKYDIQPAVLTK